MRNGPNPGRDFVLLGDQPHDGQRDPLGFDDIVEDLASLILASRASTPFTLGIEAAWGMGKSTLMARLCARLSKEETIRPVLFNAWTADDGSVLEGLVKTVLNELDANVLRRALRNRKLVSWLRVAISFAAGAVGFGNVVDTVWNRVAADPRARNDLRQLVEQSVAAWRDKQPELSDDRMLCVFVDDLDRCSPRGVLEVFEAMKLYLDVPGIVFVVGYDQDIVSDLVLQEKGYGETIKSRDYLEKFIQIVYRIPRALPERSNALVEALLETSRTAALFGKTERELVIDGSQSNPRRIKRFVNGFVLAYGLDPRWQEFEPQSLVRVQLLQMYFPEFARMLERSSERDPIEEFLEYRAARDVLRRGGRGEDAWSLVVEALKSHGLAVPGRDEGGDLEALLSRLEENVPVAFVSLANRADFTSLVQSIGAAPDWAPLRAALAEGVLPLASSEPVEPGSERSRGGRGERFEGLRVLWVDDEMAQNRSLVERLREEGAIITLVTGTPEMEVALGARAYDVLVSDIARSGMAEGGIEAVEALREQQRRLPTVIFFTSRITTARIRRVGDLGAALTTEPEELLDLLEGEARLGRGEPPGAQSDDRDGVSAGWSLRLPPPS